MKKLIRKIYRKIKKIFSKPPEPINWEEKKKQDDYDYLIKHGVETEYGYVTLGGLPIIYKHPNARIIIGKKVTLLSDSHYNNAGINHPVILSACTEGAVIELKEGSGMSGTSIVATKKVVIGEYTLLGVNTNVYDTDFHSMDSKVRQNQTSILDAECSPVVLENNVWIGGNTTILKGVTIKEGSVVSAHSLVNKNVDSFELYGGVPAKFIRKIK